MILNMFHPSWDHSSLLVMIFCCIENLLDGDIISTGTYCWPFHTFFRSSTLFPSESFSLQDCWVIFGLEIFLQTLIMIRYLVAVFYLSLSLKKPYWFIHNLGHSTPTGVCRTNVLQDVNLYKNLLIAPYWRNASRVCLASWKKLNTRKCLQL